MDDFELYSPLQEQRDRQAIHMLRNEGMHLAEEQDVERRRVESVLSEALNTAEHIAPSAVHADEGARTAYDALLAAQARQRDTKRTLVQATRALRAAELNPTLLGRYVEGVGYGQPGHWTGPPPTTPAADIAAASAAKRAAREAFDAAQTAKDEAHVDLELRAVEYMDATRPHARPLFGAQLAEAQARKAAIDARCDANTVRLRAAMAQLSENLRMREEKTKELRGNLNVAHGGVQGGGHGPRKRRASSRTSQKPSRARRASPARDPNGRFKKTRTVRA
jgi:hypothetical protein